MESGNNMSGNKLNIMHPKNIRYCGEEDIFHSNKQVLVNPINTKGVMGKGLAKKYKDNFPEMFQEYQLLCQAKKVVIGQPYLYKGERWILNFPTKDDWRQPSNIEYIRSGLEYLIEHVEEWGITSMAFPALGCGLGGLQWKDVYPVMMTYLGQLNIPVDIHASFGKPEPRKRTATGSPPDFFSPKGKKPSPMPTPSLTQENTEDTESGTKFGFGTPTKG